LEIVEMATIKTNVEVTLSALRDLAYEANCEWEKSGARDGHMLAVALAASDGLAKLSSALAGSNILILAPTKINGQNCVKKIQAIKAVREYTGLGLKDAKDIVDESCNNGWVDLKHVFGCEPTEVSGNKFASDAKAAGIEVK